jgi:uncharacterized alpha-E superfamily protein
MLSRLAESLYWIGRYLERADDTARIVDSYVHRMVEDPFNDEDATCRSLYSILGVDVDDDVVYTTNDTLQQIVFDADNPNSIAGSLSGAFENARRSRDFISCPKWRTRRVDWARRSISSTYVSAPHSSPDSRTQRSVTTTAGTFSCSVEALNELT